MKAFRYYGPRDVKLEDIPVPEIGEDEVLVAVKASGICGTDVKTYLRGHPKIPPGVVLGHEVAGVVEVSQHQKFKAGDRVVVAPYASCFKCTTCQRGHYSLCENLFEAYMDPGGFAEFVRVPKRIVEKGTLIIPDNLDFSFAALTEPLACCVHGLEALDIQKGQSLLIVGDGPMGLLQAALGRHLGASPVILSGITSDRLLVAQELADIVIDTAKNSVSEEIFSISPKGIDKVIVSVGEVSVAQASLPLIRKGGAINLFAGMPKDSQIYEKSKRIQKTVEGKITRYRNLLQRIQNYLKIRHVVSHNPKVGGSNPPPATIHRIKRRKRLRRFFLSETTITLISASVLSPSKL